MDTNKPSIFRKVFLQGIAITILVQFFAVCDRTSDVEKKRILLQTFDELQSDLLKELQTSIKTKGLAKSIEICKTLSPAKEKELSAKYPGMQISRISDRNRNPKHAPDVWEMKVISNWNEYLKMGNSPFIVSESTSNELRVMKPILIGNETCLKCHGPIEKIDANTRAALKQMYPEDKAIGYKLGDLRGAFSGTWKRL